MHAANCTALLITSTNGLGQNVWYRPYRKRRCHGAAQRAAQLLVGVRSRSPVSGTELASRGHHSHSHSVWFFRHSAPVPISSWKQLGERERGAVRQLLSSDTSVLRPGNASARIMLLLALRKKIKLAKSFGSVWPSSPCCRPSLLQ
jgi:hypothetical protein